jgi:hypothetical protein
MAGSTDPGSHGTWVEVPGGQGVQVGDHSTQDNTFIGQYVGTQILPAQPAPVAWPVRVGDVPQIPPAFQPRKALLAAPGQPLASHAGCARGHRDAGGWQDAGGRGVCPVPDG